MMQVYSERLLMEHVHMTRTMQVYEERVTFPEKGGFSVDFKQLFEMAKGARAHIARVPAAWLHTCGFV